MAATLDQVFGLLQTVNRKLDTLIAEEGIIMTQQDDLSTELAADTAELKAEEQALADNYARLTGLVSQLEQQAGQPVSADVLNGFRSAVAGLKPAVDKITTVGQAAPPAPPPSPAPGPVGTPGGEPAPSAVAASGQPGAQQPQQQTVQEQGQGQQAGQVQLDPAGGQAPQPPPQQQG